MPRILLIDDTFDCAEPLARLLRLGGHVVVLAPDGLDALGSLAEAAPDLILLDLNMPRLDGLGFLRHLRHDPEYARWHSTPVIITSATATAKALDAARALGVSHFLTKSIFALPELEQCISDALASPNRTESVKH